MEYSYYYQVIVTIVISPKQGASDEIPAILCKSGYTGALTYNEYEHINVYVPVDIRYYI